METPTETQVESVNATPKTYQGGAVRFPGSPEPPSDTDLPSNMETEPASNGKEPAPPPTTRAERAAEGFQFPDLDDEDAGTFLKETINATPKFYDGGPVVLTPKPKTEATQAFQAAEVVSGPP